MKQSMNILIGKLGKSTKFNVDKHGFTNGDEEAPNLYVLLAKRFPEHNFYFCCKSDITKVRNSENTESIFDDEISVSSTIPSNIIDLYDDWSNKSKSDPADWLYDKVRRLGLIFDCGIIYQGPIGNINVANKGTQRLDGLGPAKTLEMLSNYAGPAIHLLNMTGIPYMLLCGDPRYVPTNCRDAFNIERVTLTQTNLVSKVKRIQSYIKSNESECVYHDINYVYSGIETGFMLTEKKIDFRNTQKTNKFVIGLNGGYSRDQFIHDWILNTDIDKTGIKIYGEWSDEFTSKYPDLFENASIKSVESVFLNSRYTIIPPPHQPMKTFVTQKFWKMIHYGIIPFFHPDYDTLKIFKVPSILRIKTPKEMWENIEYLDDNPEEYRKILKCFYNILNDDYYNGNFLSNTVTDAADKYMNIKL